jgi:hypothetical protein
VSVVVFYSVAVSTASTRKLLMTLGVDT